jgi:hypothetical protein
MPIIAQDGKPMLQRQGGDPPIVRWNRNASIVVFACP